MNNNGIKDPIVRIIRGRERRFCPVEDCLHEYASKHGYLTQRGYENHFVNYHLKSETVGFASRIDFGSPGYREGLLRAAWDVFTNEDTRFIIIAGGLVSYPHLKGQLTVKALDDLWNEIWGPLYDEADKKKKKPSRPARVERARRWLLRKWTNELAEAIPRIKAGGKYVKIYIVTSPAHKYDGPIGAEIARRLAKKRRDIRFWGERSRRFPMKRQNKVVWVLTPAKAPWRGKYYSTPFDRLIEDEQKQTSHPLPDLWVVGCLASGLQRPRGENPRRRISLPALHQLQEVHTSENQVGVRVVEFSPISADILVRTYNFKDFTAQEARWIPDPESATPLEQKVVATLKVAALEGKDMTIGLLEGDIEAPRSQIAAAIETLNESGYQPKIVYDGDSELYDFDPDWIQKKLGYPPGDTAVLEEDIIATVGCLHAGNVRTQYNWFIEDVPKKLLEWGSTILVGAGDFIIGLKHNLIERGEVMAGLNYTQQERLAAHLIGTVMLKVFKTRFAKALNGFRNRKPTDEELETMIRESLLTFFYIAGNHDDWLRPKGVTPLMEFRSELIRHLAEGTTEILGKRGLWIRGLYRILEEKVVYGEVHQLPSGLKIAIKHPFMARAQTTSLRAQGVLQAVESHIALIANFHVGISVEQWESEIGQRVAQQVGTILSGSDYEDGKLKKVDTCIGHLRVLSCEGHIYMSEIAFFSKDEDEEKEEYNNEALLEAFMKRFDI